MPKKSTRPVKLKIHKTPEPLLDKSILGGGGKHIPKVVAISAGLGLLVGGGLLAYLSLYNDPFAGTMSPEIIVPEEELNLPSTSSGTTSTTTPTTTETVQVVVQQVEILDTPTGFLNVRTGPGTNFAKVSQVKPGEVYEFVSETSTNGGWHQIKLDAVRTGWVIKKYSQIK